MSIVFMDGLDLYDATSDISSAFNIMNSVSLNTTGGRFGGGSLEITNYGNFNSADGFTLSFPTDISGTVVIQAAVFVPSGSDTSEGAPVVALGNDNTGIDDQTFWSPNLAIESSNGDNWFVRDSAGTTWDISGSIPSTTDVWRYIEIKADVGTSNASIVVRVNNVEALNTTGDTSSGSPVTQALFGNAVTVAGARWDDIILMDGAGTQNNDLLGDVRIATLLPNADGDTSNYTPANGGANYEEVDEVPHDSDTTHNEAGSVGGRDLFGFEDLSLDVESILALKVANTERKTGTDALGASPVVKSGTTTSVGTEKTLTTKYERTNAFFEANPDTGSQWTKAELNNVQVGYEITS